MVGSAGLAIVVAGFGSAGLGAGAGWSAGLGSGAFVVTGVSVTTGIVTADGLVWATVWPAASRNTTTYEYRRPAAASPSA